MTPRYVVMPPPHSTGDRLPPPWQGDFAAGPIFASVAEWGTHFSGQSAWPSLERLNQAAGQAHLCNARGLPIQFATQSKRLGQYGYELQIQQTGLVSTRTQHWHDLLNALVWLSFPETKAALNALQCRELSGVREGRRSPQSDAATLFDESGLLIISLSDRIPRMLRDKAWQEAFIACREAWTDEVQVLVFGHALLEKALSPFPGITAKCFHLRAAPYATPQARLDHLVAQAWAQGEVERPSDLFPVPLLGIPGFWQGNNDVAFYQRQDIFRPALR